MRRRTSCAPGSRDPAGQSRRSLIRTVRTRFWLINLGQLTEVDSPDPPIARMLAGQGPNVRSVTGVRSIRQAVGEEPDLAPVALDHLGIQAYLTLMIRFFDIADHDRLPWRFTALTRCVLARLR